MRLETLFLSAFFLVLIQISVSQLNDELKYDLTQPDIHVPISLRCCQHLGAATIDPLLECLDEVTYLNRLMQLAADTRPRVTMFTYVTESIGNYAGYAAFVNAVYAEQNSYSFHILGREKEKYARGFNRIKKVNPYQGSSDPRWNKIHIMLQALRNEPDPHTVSKEVEVADEDTDMYDFDRNHEEEREDEGEETHGHERSGLNKQSYVAWVDADLIILDLDMRIEAIGAMYPDADLIMSRDLNHAEFVSNTGFIIARRTEWSLAFFQQWWSAYDRTRCCDQNAFTWLYDRFNQENLGHVKLLRSDAINSNFPAWKNQKEYNQVLHLAGASSLFRGPIFKSAMEELCRAGYEQNKIAIRRKKEEEEAKVGAGVWGSISNAIVNNMNPFASEPLTEPEHIYNVWLEEERARVRPQMGLTPAVLLKHVIKLGVSRLASIEKLAILRSENPILGADRRTISLAIFSGNLPQEWTDPHTTYDSAASSKVDGDSDSDSDGGRKSESRSSYNDTCASTDTPVVERGRQEQYCDDSGRQSLISPSSLAKPNYISTLPKLPQEERVLGTVSTEAAHVILEIWLKDMALAGKYVQQFQSTLTDVIKIDHDDTWEVFDSMRSRLAESMGYELPSQIENRHLCVIRAWLLGNYRSIALDLAEILWYMDVHPDFTFRSVEIDLQHSLMLVIEGMSTPPIVKAEQGMTGGYINSLKGPDTTDTDRATSTDKDVDVGHKSVDDNDKTLLQKTQQQSLQSKESELEDLDEHVVHGFHNDYATSLGPNGGTIFTKLETSSPDVEVDPKVEKMTRIKFKKLTLELLKEAVSRAFELVLDLEANELVDSFATQRFILEDVGQNLLGIMEHLAPESLQSKVLYYRFKQKQLMASTYTNDRVSNNQQDHSMLLLAIQALEQAMVHWRSMAKLNYYGSDYVMADPYKEGADVLNNVGNLQCMTASFNEGIANLMECAELQDLTLTGYRAIRIATRKDIVEGQVALAQTLLSLGICSIDRFHSEKLKSIGISAAITKDIRDAIMYFQRVRAITETITKHNSDIFEETSFISDRAASYYHKARKLLIAEHLTMNTNKAPIYDSSSNINVDFDDIDLGLVDTPSQLQDVNRNLCIKDSCLNLVGTGGVGIGIHASKMSAADLKNGYEPKDAETILSSGFLKGIRYTLSLEGVRELRIDDPPDSPVLVVDESGGRRNGDSGGYNMVRQINGKMEKGGEPLLIRLDKSKVGQTADSTLNARMESSENQLPIFPIYSDTQGHNRGQKLYRRRKQSSN